jgi:hypothetical protein
MGCAAYAGAGDRKEFDLKLVRKIDSFRPKSDDGSVEYSVEVLEKGKNLDVSQLDKITDKQIENNSILDRHLNESTEMISPCKNQESPQNISNSIPQNSSIPENQSSKKLNFEIHPHLFDFSFLEENTEQEELAEQVLKEVSNLKIYE